MQVQCTHCGASNDTDPIPGGAVTVVCGGCMRPFTAEADDSVLARVPLKKKVVSVGPPRALLAPPAPSGGFDFSSLGDDLDIGLATRPGGTRPGAGGATAPDGLGATPGLDEPYDLSALLDAPPVGAEPLDGSVTDFTFGDEADLFSQGGPAGADPLAGLSRRPLGGAADEPAEDTVAHPGFDAPTRVVDAPQDTGSRQGWRVRSERGLVYELMTVDAVVAWLEGKSDIEGVRLARGDGDFRPVDEFPQIAARLGVRPRREEVRSEEPGLSLAVDRAPPRRTSARREEQRAARPRPGERTDARKEPLPEAPFGMGLVLALLFGAVGVGTVLVLAGVGAGYMSLPPQLAEAAATEPAPSAALAAAIEDLNAGSYTAAATRLEKLAEAGSDPRVYRYLALALMRTNREREARDALAEYRRSLQRTGR